MRAHGFTLIEVIITVVIVAILATGAMPVIQLTVKRNKESELRGDLREIRTAIDLYKKAVDAGKIRKSLEQTGYPPNLEVLESGVQDVTSPKRKLIKFIRKIPRDPMTNYPDRSPAQTWGTRSYDSDSDSPREGVDVYDVYSLSLEKGVNGTSYNTW